jgi:hypothetical protein
LVNEGLAAVVTRWRGRPDELRFARKLFWELGGFHWVDRIERLAMKSPAIKRLPRGRTLYWGAPICHARVIFFAGTGETVKVNGARLGSDKLGHFFSQGFKYFRRQRHGWSDKRFLGWASRVEALIFGEMTTSVYSNADLVANYEGYRFYRSLFENDVIPGKPAIIQWQGERPVIRREFTWRDHVNDYWDEALNPSYLNPGLQRHVERFLKTLCTEFAKDPAAFKSAREDELRLRYAEVGLKDNRRNLVERVCAPE